MVKERRGCLSAVSSGQFLPAFAAVHLGKDLRVDLQQPRSSLGLYLNYLIRVLGAPKRGSFDRIETTVQVDGIEPPQHAVFYPVEMRDVEQAETCLDQQ